MVHEECGVLGESGLAGRHGRRSLGTVGICRLGTERKKSPKGRCRLMGRFSLDLRRLVGFVFVTLVGAAGMVLCAACGIPVPPSSAAPPPVEQCKSSSTIDTKGY